MAALAEGTDLEASLLSFEKLDRASPDLWPEQLPGVAEFAASFKSFLRQNSGFSSVENELFTQRVVENWNTLLESVIGETPFRDSRQSWTSSGAQPIASSPPKWMAELENDDIDMLKELGSLTTANLMEKVRGLQNLAYQLGLDESREMTRGKFLNILEKPKK
uniref:Protein lin-52 homolog n=1 Tax=Geotrypetes seraphini TaxID=260995 RepID=A0A6P8RNK7_GEOSA|nr:protein lin-52 homolog isoform X2 [Geotrypetes seraphini]